MSEGGTPLGLAWWAYKHVDGSLHVKRYFGPEDLREAMESHFVQWWMPRFDAPNRAAAVAQAKVYFGRVAGIFDRPQAK